MAPLKRHHDNEAMGDSRYPWLRGHGPLKEANRMVDQATVSMAERSWLH